MFHRSSVCVFAEKMKKHFTKFLRSYNVHVLKSYFLQSFHQLQDLFSNLAESFICIVLRRTVATESETMLESNIRHEKEDELSSMRIYVDQNLQFLQREKK